MFQLLKKWRKGYLIKKAKLAKNQTDQLSLANDPDVDVRMALLENDELFFSVLEQLVYDHDKKIRMWLAENISDEIIIDDLIRNETDASVLHKLAFKKLTVKQELDLMRKDCLQANCRLAMNTKHKSIMILLANYPNEIVRIKLTQNENLDHQIYKILVADESDNVRFAISVNMPYSDLLMVLAEDSSDVVKRGVAGNTCASQETLYKLSKSSDCYIRAAVAGNEAFGNHPKKKRKQI